MTWIGSMQGEAEGKLRRRPPALSNRLHFMQIRLTVKLRRSGRRARTDLDLVVRLLRCVGLAQTRALPLRRQWLI
jgi:hypothetical protein